LGIGGMDHGVAGKKHIALPGGNGEFGAVDDHRAFAAGAAFHKINTADHGTKAAAWLGVLRRGIHDTYVGQRRFFVFRKFSHFNTFQQIE